ncbi:hypothetical protein CDAR_305221 [Caerostris darwini]|uniref:Uncharacterized protein n=1 Tax=Caerostris darwini TaxID=1538125 RepID=A0AAV4MFH2_9ARAC|nr:hypothetical protein CDAR_305221 [Caerostris darwini]
MSQEKVKSIGKRKNDYFKIIEVQNDFSKITLTEKNDESNIIGAAKHDFEMIEKLNNDLSSFNLTESDPEITGAGKDDFDIIEKLNNDLSFLNLTENSTDTEITGAPKDNFENIEKFSKDLFLLNLTDNGNGSEITRTTKDYFAIIEKLNSDLSILNSIENDDHNDITGAEKVDGIPVATENAGLKIIETENGDFQVTDELVKHDKDFEDIDVIQLRMRFNIFEQILKNAQSLQEQLGAVEHFIAVNSDNCSRIYEKVRQKKTVDSKLNKDVALIMQWETKFNETWRLIGSKMASISLMLYNVKKNIQKSGKNASRQWWHYAIRGLKREKSLKKALPAYMDAIEKFMADVKKTIEKYNLDN